MTNGEVSVVYDWSRSCVWRFTMNFADVNSMLNIHLVMGVTARIFLTEKSLCQEQNLSQLSFKKFCGAGIQSEFSLFLETNLSLFWQSFCSQNIFHWFLIPFSKQCQPIEPAFNFLSLGLIIVPTDQIDRHIDRRTDRLKLTAEGLRDKKVSIYLDYVRMHLKSFSFQLLVLQSGISRRSENGEKLPFK
jgi:hypothetical protein